MLEIENFADVFLHHVFTWDM
jgi:hypothetical protein